MNCNFSYNESVVLHPDFLVFYQWFVISVCSLSLIGGAAIILSYVGFPSLRRHSSMSARHFLVNLSVADMLVAGSHLIGVNVNFLHFITGPHKLAMNDTVNNTNPLCETQAFFSMVGNISSLLWTIVIGIHMLTFLFVANKGWRIQYAVFYPVCWGVPLAIAGWVLADKKLGFGGVPLYYKGWCYFRKTNGNNSVGGFDPLYTIVGYDFWNYLVIIVLPVLFCVTAYFVRKHRKKSNADLKLIYVPVILVFLRIMCAIVNVIVYYLHTDQRNCIGRTLFYALSMVIYVVGINGQAFANSILFLVFTKSYRRKIIELFTCKKCKWKWRRSLGRNAGPINERSSLMREATTPSINYTNEDVQQKTPTAEVGNEVFLDDEQVGIMSTHLNY